MFPPNVADLIQRIEWGPQTQAPAVTNCDMQSPNLGDPHLEKA